MFHPQATVEKANELGKNGMIAHLGIKITEIGKDFIKGTMPVDSRTHQPYGMLHGGASVALAETLGSLASSYCINNDTQICVGQEINANHIRSVWEGEVEGTAKPLHVGKKSHVWEIKINDMNGNLVCISRMTVAVLERKNH